ncbi:unnamed protein product, partial [marine sediment metagenome]
MNNEQILLTKIEKEKEYISFLAHEIKNPLEIMNESLSLLADKVLGNINSEQKEIINIISNNISKLNYLVEDILYASKIEAANFALKKESIKIASLISEIINNLKLSYQQQQINFIFEPNNELTQIKINIDPLKIEQVFLNILVNAIKFVPQENGQIKIKLIKPEDHLL